MAGRQREVCLALLWVFAVREGLCAGRGGFLTGACAVVFSFPVARVESGTVLSRCFGSFQSLAQAAEGAGRGSGPGELQTRAVLL